MLLPFCHRVGHILTQYCILTYSYYIISFLSHYNYVRIISVKHTRPEKKFGIVFLITEVETLD